MHLLLVADDPSLGDPGSEAFARHAAYAQAMAARRPGAFLAVLAPGVRKPLDAPHMRVGPLVGTETFDAVSAQAPWSSAAWRIAATRRIPFLAQFHFDPFAPCLPGPRDLARRLLGRLAARRAARVRVMVPATAEEMARRWRIPAERIWVAPVPFRRPDGSELREPLVVGAMRLVPERVPKAWIEVASMVAIASPNMRVVLAGDGPLRARLERDVAQATSLVPDAKIALPGHLASAALDVLLGRARVFLHTAPHEAFGRAIAEALAAGVPVVARRTTGAAHLVRDGETGLLGDNNFALAAAVLHLILRPERAAEMSEAARRDMAGRFAPEAMQARVVDFLLGERTDQGMPCATC